MTNDSDIDRQEPHTESPDTRLDPAFMQMALVLLLAMLMALLDETIVNVGVKSLTAEFGATLATIQWVTAGYILAVAVATPFAGWAVDRFGGKRMWLAAVGVFLAGSLLCGLAWSAESLIGFRVVQGLGGGMIIPIVQTVLARTAGEARVAKAMGLISIPLTLGPILGPIIGGVLIDAASWRWMFWINVPIGIIALALGVLKLPADEKSDDSVASLDVIGLLLVSPGFALIIYGLTTAGGGGSFGDIRVVIAFALGLVLLAGYVVHALTTRSTPLIDVRMFRNRGFSFAVVTMFLVGAVANSILLLTPLYLQQSRDFDAFHAGLLLIPSGVLGAAGAISSGKLADKFTARTTSTIGMAITAVGAAGLVTVGSGTSQIYLLLAVGITGYGIGLTAPGTMAHMYKVVGAERAARATSALFIFNQLGGAIGIASVAVLLETRLDGDEGYPAAAYGGVYWLVVGFAVVAALSALLIPGKFRVTAPDNPAGLDRDSTEETYQ
ncbi:DHA2 family efflux MFS transporter permease subunit [Rhodococcoides kyotonense]|uniref:Drug resistance transporter, EmrB/QacA subfamily n=1 Tax=Rhodococcoides kyotonense TaxID=398843 RepID=A0A239MCS2_9NOCA|nr:DHA2 family efflux MFS transporter permease subunit [Rhodococcus kyotonensis]SNT39943.1 drug resistance transporter, EmrB/QacA subfamily [Rhodococcus kyotonensis]